MYTAWHSWDGHLKQATSPACRVCKYTVQLLESAREFVVEYDMTATTNIITILQKQNKMGI